MPPTAFISGPLSPAPAYFATHYLPALTRAIAAGHKFILGPSAGVDSLALTYLLTQIPASRITIYLSPNQAHMRAKKYVDFEGSGGRVVVVDKPGHTARDEACTRASHYDILRYATVEEQRAEYGVGYRERVSGTQKNEIRRRGGVGLVWNEVVATEVVVDEEGRRRKGLERKVREARRLQERLEAGERLEVNQMRKISAVEGWERELSALNTGSTMAN